MNARELISYGRAAGFEPIHRSLTGRTLCWTNGKWRIEATVYEVPLVTVEVFKRVSPNQFQWLDTLYARDAAKLFRDLSVIGALPGWVEAA